jgi:arsenite methyltransferase
MQEQHIKEKVKERDSKIALTGSSYCYCVPGECCDDSNNSHHSIVESTKLIGYDIKDIGSIPETSVLGVGFGAPTQFAEISGTSKIQKVNL